MIDYRNDLVHKQLIIFGKDLKNNISGVTNIKADGPYFIEPETKTISELISKDKQTQQGIVSTCYGGRTLRSIYTASSNDYWYMLMLYNPKYNKYLKVYTQGFKTIRGK